MPEKHSWKARQPPKPPPIIVAVMLSEIDKVENYIINVCHTRPLMVRSPLHAVVL